MTSLLDGKGHFLKLKLKWDTISVHEGSEIRIVVRFAHKMEL